MLKKTIEYRDYNDTLRKEDFYFNLTQAEVVEMETEQTGGLAEMITRAVNAKDMPAVIKIFKDLVLRAYGEKSLDGRQFIKNDKVRESFAQTEAYSILFMELATDADAAAAFVKGILPANLAQAINK